MSRIQTNVLAELPGLGLLISNDLIGNTFGGRFHEETVRITFPSSDSDFGLPSGCFGNFAQLTNENELTWPESNVMPRVSETCSETGTSGDESPRGYPIGPWQRTSQLVRIVRVSMDRNAPFSAQDFRHEGDELAGDGLGELQTQFIHFWLSIEKVFQDFLRHFVGSSRRRTRQYWAGTSMDTGRLIGAMTFYDLDNRLDIPDRAAHWDSSDIVVNGLLNRDELSVILEDDEYDNQPDLTTTLIYDAHYIGRIQQPPDLRLSLLLAAIAVETKVDQVLQSVCEDSSSALLKLVLNERRYPNVPIMTHLNMTLEAVAGSSLYKSDRKLWNRMEKLYTLRNSLVHGRPIGASDQEIVDAILAATETIAWLSDAF